MKGAQKNEDDECIVGFMHTVVKNFWFFYWLDLFSQVIIFE